MSQQQQDTKVLQQLQQRKQKQQELAALNAKLKSLSKPVGKTQMTDTEVNVGTKNCKENGAVQTDIPNQKAGIIPQRKIVSLAARSPTKLKPQSKSENPHNKGIHFVNSSSNQEELDGLLRVINFSGSEDESDGESDYESETNQSEKHETDQSDEEENDSFVVRNIHVHAKNHDTCTNDRNNNENLQAAAIAPENNNRNNRTSVTTGSESSRSSNVLEVHFHSNSDQGPSPVSNNLSSSAGSGTLKFDTHNGNTDCYGDTAEINKPKEPDEVKHSVASDGKFVWVL